MNQNVRIHLQKIFKRIIHIFIWSIVLMVIIIIGLIGMFVAGNLATYERIGESNYYIIDFHEAWPGYSLRYETESNEEKPALGNDYQVEDVYWNDKFILVKCFHDYGTNLYYKISLDTCEMNYTLISPATFYNTLDWQKSNGYKMEHRHFEF